MIDFILSLTTEIPLLLRSWTGFLLVRIGICIIIMLVFLDLVEPSLIMCPYVSELTARPPPLKRDFRYELCWRLRSDFKRLVWDNWSLPVRGKKKVLISGKKKQRD
jgi:hypothetical protein